MKNIVLYIFLIGMFAVGCSEYDVLDSKPGESIDPVTNLAANVVDTTAVLTWTLPSSYPVDIVKPVSVVIQIYTVDQGSTPSLLGLMSVGSVAVADAPTTYTYADYDSGETYKFVVKVKGTVDVSKYEDPDYQSSIRFSEGVSVTL